jgi:hypothetical protein
MLRFFSASNDIVNSKAAMKDCIQRALVNEGSSDCDLIVFHTTMGHNFKELLDAAREICPNAVVTGCTGMGVIGREGAVEKMRSLAVMAIKGGKNEFVVAFSDKISGPDSYETGVRLASEIKEKNPDVNMINILASGYDIAADRALAGIESVFSRQTPVFGGTASDNLKMKTNFQFLNDRIIEGGAVLIGFADPSLQVVMAAHHGNRPIGLPFEVTRSQGNRIYELDNKPAWPYLMDKLNRPPTVPLGEVVALACLGEMLPSELHEEYDNKHILRVIVGVDEKNESFFLPVTCPSGTKLWLVERDEDMIFGGLDRMLSRLMKKLDGKKPVAVFHTDCGARGRLMFNEISKEEIISRMQRPLCGEGDIPWLGLYGFGEITMLGGKNYFHNQTTSLYVLTRKG